MDRRHTHITTDVFLNCLLGIAGWWTCIDHPSFGSEVLRRGRRISQTNNGTSVSARRRGERARVSESEWFTDPSDLHKCFKGLFSNHGEKRRLALQAPSLHRASLLRLLSWASESFIYWTPCCTSPLSLLQSPTSVTMNSYNPSL